MFGIEVQGLAGQVRGSGLRLQGVLLHPPENDMKQGFTGSLKGIYRVL